MRKIFLLFLTSLCFTSVFAQFTVDTAIVPQFAVGHSRSSTVNFQRLPFYCWVELSGLNADSTYIYSCLMDTGFNTLKTGAGTPVWIDIAHDSIYANTSVAFSKSAKRGTFKADHAGKYKGWFSTVPDNNYRFKAGHTVYFKVLTNGGTSASADTTVSVVTPINKSIKMLNFRDSSRLYDCSFVYDSTYSAPKSFVFLYDNVNGRGRPLSAAVVESDGVNMNYPVNGGPFNLSTYKARVDGKASLWGTAIPDTLPTGVRRLEYRYFATGSIDTLFPTPKDTQGIWPLGAVTINPTNDTAALHICSLCSAYLDMAINNIKLPDTMYSCNRTSTAVSVVLLNNCSIPEASFYMYYQVNNDPVVVENVGPHFVIVGYYYPSRNDTVYTFKTPATIKPMGMQQRIKIWVSLPGEPASRQLNDTGVYYFYSLPSPIKDSLSVTRDTIKINTPDSFATKYQAMKYKWYFGDTLKGNDSTAALTHTYKALGNYKVTVIGNSGACGKDTLTHNVVVVDHYTGEHNIKALPHTITVYPNPTSRELTLTGITRIPTAVNVYNLLGQMMPCNFEWHNGSLVVNTTHLVTGQYFIRISTGGNTITRRFTKD